MNPIAEAMLRDIDKETVDFGPNYDGSQTEPLVLPAAFPFLLANGSSGIAVGMATNIPPQNLREICAAIVKLIDAPVAADEDVMKLVRGPDFPTGGIILGRKGIRDAYLTGRGRVVVRAKVTVEDPEVLAEPWVLPPRMLRLNPNKDAGLLPEATPCRDYDHDNMVTQIRH